MPPMKLPSEQDFWSADHCGRRIAVFNQHGRWHAYLDDIHQHNMVFDTAESAARWLAARAESLSFKRAA
jgi:hypothetical protein